MFNEEELVARATQALARRAAIEGFIFDQPSAAFSGIEDGKVVLRNTPRGVLAVYAIDARGRLRFDAAAAEE